MKISFGTKVKGPIGESNGYGYATKGMLNSLASLGYQVERNDASADVEIYFDQPQHWDFSEGPYKIGYLPWESTELLTADMKMSGGINWIDAMNECDEIWTPSALIAGWFKQYAGVLPPVHVYEHGIEHSWEPKPRVVDDTLKFLMVGAEATRKGGWDTVRLFRQAFPNNKDVSLTIKMIHSSWNGIPSLGRVTYINDRWSLEQMQDLFYDHHAYVYPSWGEGFGLTPLQAMATGMPTISTAVWAPYRKFMDPKLIISSSMAKSVWKEIHPGYMLRPSFDDVIDNMRYTYDNYDKVHEFAQKQTEGIHDTYDWDTITKKVFSDLEKRLESR